MIQQPCHTQLRCVRTSRDTQTSETTAEDNKQAQASARTRAQLTGVEQQLHHREVGVRDGVVKSCIPVAVCHVDHELQQLRGDGGEGAHVGLDNGGVRRFVTGDAQPLLQHGGVGGPLGSDTKRPISEAVAEEARRQVGKWTHSPPPDG